MPYSNHSGRPSANFNIVYQFFPFKIGLSDFARVLLSDGTINVEHVTLTLTFDLI